MLIVLVSIEQNCTFNLEVLRLYLCVSSGHLPTGPHGEPLPYMVCSDPESRTDHSLKKVSACLTKYFGKGWTQDWATQGSCHMDVCAICYPLLEVIYFLFTIDKHMHVYICKGFKCRTLVLNR